MSRRWVQKPLEGPFAEMEADPAVNRLGPSEDLPTSRAAALENAPRSGNQRGRVLLAVVSSPQGMTDAEIEVAVGLPHQSAGPRRRELVLGGWIRDSGGVRPTPFGCDATVWVPTDKALAWRRDTR